MEVIARAEGRDDEAFIVDVDAPVGDLARDIAARLQLTVPPEDIELFADGQDAALPHDVPLLELGCGIPRSVVVHVPAPVRAAAALAAQNIIHNDDKVNAWRAAVTTRHAVLLRDLFVVVMHERGTLYLKLMHDVRNMTVGELAAVLDVDACAPVAIRAHAMQMLLEKLPGSSDVLDGLCSQHHVSTAELYEAVDKRATAQAFLRMVAASPFLLQFLERGVLTADAPLALCVAEVCRGGAAAPAVAALAARRAAGIVEDDGCHVLAVAVAHKNTEAFDAFLQLPEVVAGINTLSRASYTNAEPLRTKDYGDNTALFHACTCRQEHAVTLLLAAGADVNVSGAGGPALLHILAHPDSETDLDVRFIQQLLAAGADPSAVDASGVNVLHAIAPHTHLMAALEPQLREVLAGRVDVNSKLRNGCTALTAAAATGNVVFVGLLLDHGADPAAVDNDGATALYRAVVAQVECVDICERLVPAGGSLVDRPHSSGVTPLIAAAALGRVATVRLLLQHGADARRADRRGRTALHAIADATGAAVRGAAVRNRNRVDIIKALLAAGADPDATADDGSTAHAVAKAVHMPREICKALRTTETRRGCTLQ